jgi:hypothetical protein
MAQPIVSASFRIRTPSGGWQRSADNSLVAFRRPDQQDHVLKPARL